MNFMSILNLMVSPATSTGTDAASGGFMSKLGIWGIVIYMVVIFGAMYFIMIRPQKKRQKKEQELRENIQVGDEIVTIGGIYGKVMALKDDSLIIETGPDRDKVRIARWSVQQNLTIHDEQK